MVARLRIKLDLNVLTCDNNFLRNKDFLNIYNIYKESIII